MKNSKNNRTAILAVILVGLMILAYKVMFAPGGVDSSIDENLAATERVEAILRQIDSINFDTSVMEDKSFQSLESIATPLISLPVGRANPFSGLR